MCQEIQKAHCVNCSEPYSPLRRGRCLACASYFYRHGVERPAESLKRRAARSRDGRCNNANCQLMSKPLRGGRCGRCDAYWRRCGVERPTRIAWKGTPHTAATKQMLSQMAKARAQTPEGKAFLSANGAKGIRAVSRKRPTNIERAVARALTEMAIDFEFQAIIGKHRVDFRIGNLTILKSMGPTCAKNYRKRIGGGR
jgi:hypothetical protein